MCTPCALFCVLNFLRTFFFCAKCYVFVSVFHYTMGLKKISNFLDSLAPPNFVIFSLSALPLHCSMPDYINNGCTLTCTAGEETGHF